MGFKVVLKKFNGYLRKVSKEFLGSFKCVSRWRGVPRDLQREFHRYLKEVQRVFQGSFKDILRKF